MARLIFSPLLEEKKKRGTSSSLLHRRKGKSVYKEGGGSRGVLVVGEEIYGGKERGSAPLKKEAAQ